MGIKTVRKLGLFNGVLKMYEEKRAKDWVYHIFFGTTCKGVEIGESGDP